MRKSMTYLSKPQAKQLAKIMPFLEHLLTVMLRAAYHSHGPPLTARRHIGQKKETKASRNTTPLRKKAQKNK